MSGCLCLIPGTAVTPVCGSVQAGMWGTLTGSRFLSVITVHGGRQEGQGGG